MLSMGDDVRTSILLACQGGHLTVVQYYVEKCSFDVKIANDVGWTALHEASRYGRLEIVKYLVQEHLAIKTREGSTPWHMARDHGQNDVVDYFEQVCGISMTAARRILTAPSNELPTNRVDAVVLEALAKLTEQVGGINNNINSLSQQNQHNHRDLKSSIASASALTIRALKRMEANMERVLGGLAHIATHKAEICPTLVWLVPAKRTAGNSVEAWMQRFKSLSQETFDLYFVCQHSYEAVETKIQIPVTRAWLKLAAPVIYLTIFIVKTAATVYGIPLPLPMSDCLGNDLYAKIIEDEFDDATSKAMEVFKSIYADGADHSLENYSTHLQTLTGKSYDAIAEKATQEGLGVWKKSMASVIDNFGNPIWVKKKYVGDYSRAPPLEA